MPMEPTHTNRGAALTDLIRSVFPLNGSLLDAGDRLSGDVGLSSALWQVLGAIADDPRSVAQIGRIMGLTRQSVQRSVGVLRTDGLVEFIPNPNHKTSPLVQVTPKGQRAYREVMRLQVDWSNDLAKNFKTEEIKVAVRVLRSFLEALEKHE